LDDECHSGMNDAFRSSSRSTRIKDDARLIRFQSFRFTSEALALDDVMPIEVASFFHFNIQTESLDDDNFLDEWNVIDDIVNFFFQLDDVAATRCSVRCDDHFRFEIDQTIAQSVL